MSISIYAVVKSGVVVNLINWDGNTSQWSPPSGATAVLVPTGTGVDIGWAYANGTFSPPH